VGVFQHRLLFKLNSTPHSVVENFMFTTDCKLQKTGIFLDLTFSRW